MTGKAFEVLSSRVVRVMGLNPGPFTLDGTNTYLVGTGSERILIDTGEGKPGYQASLKETLQALNITTIKHILISHRHYDHIGGINQVYKIVGKSPSVHKYMCLGEQGEYIPLEDGQLFSVEGASLKTIYTPGHTNDHCVFHLLEENALFTGDCILGSGTAVFENLTMLMKSLSKLKELNPAKLLCGHGPVVDDGPSKIQEYIEHRLQRENQIIKVLAKSDGCLTIREICDIIYPGYPSNLIKSAEGSVKLHLWKLVDEGRASQNVDKFKLCQV